MNIHSFPKRESKNAGPDDPITKERMRIWYEENKEAIDASNRDVRENGTFSERIGLWKA